MLRRILPLILVIMAFTATAQTQNSKMNAFVADLMKKMTLDEKIGQLNLLTDGGGVPTGSVVNTNVETKIKEGKVGGLFGITGVEKIRRAQEIAVTGSRLKIPLIFGLDIIHGYRTTFPIPLAMASSWDMKLIEKSARTASLEATADGLNWAYSPMVDIARDPRWGRVAEGSGEDPYLGSLIAKAMVRGYQGNDLADKTTLMACVKHYALYGAAEAGRDYNTTDMSRLRMYESYFPPYKAAVEAGAGSIMSSFNEIDGIPATANKWLMTEVLRKQWGFSGFVVTDYTSINEMIDHGLGDLQTVSAMALKAGIDMDMVGEGFLSTLKKSLQEGKVTQKEIDDACRRVLEAKYKLGLFDDPFRYCDLNRAKTEITSADKKAVARDLAIHSQVLLKNDNNILPLKKSGTIALVGPMADNKDMLGTWAVGGIAANAVPITTGIRNAVGSSVNIIYAKGANITDDPVLARNAQVFGKTFDIGSPQAQLDEAVQAANKADIVVAVVGESSEMTGEAASRSEISLPASQRNLLEALAKTGKPLVVVLMTGRPLAIVRESELANAMLLTWFGGDETGNAVADVLFGAYNPSGKLPMTFPRNVGQVPIYYSHKKTGRPQGDGPTQKFRSNYLDVSNEPLYPFGYGLSYTSFNYSEVKLSSNKMTKGQTVKATVTVTNSGNFDGEEVVQLYINDPVASVTQPVKKLVGFQKISLKKGESRDISFNITEEELKFYNNDLKRIVEPGEFHVYIGTSSSNAKKATFNLQ
ncbi:MAG TPA: beta-glucosidase BglX [Chitinophagaceae bacterium]|nr:beta-glucosidase BglX [Chitinophagaceae bacterium]